MRNPLLIISWIIIPVEVIILILFPIPSFLVNSFRYFQKSLFLSVGALHPILAILSAIFILYNGYVELKKSIQQKERMSKISLQKTQLLKKELKILKFSHSRQASLNFPMNSRGRFHTH